MSNHNNSTQGAIHPGLLYFYSEAFGLASNGICALYAALSNVGVLSIVNNHQTDSSSTSTTENTTIQALTFVVVGAAVQLLCASRAYSVHDHFTATAFGFFSTFWFFLGVELLDKNDGGVNDKGYLHDWELARGTFYLSIFIVTSSLFCIAFFVNKFNVILMASIALPLGGETVISFIDSNSRAVRILKVLQGASQFNIFLVCGYGCVAAVLRGIHERQVLPGFDNAVIESVLWKNKPNIQTYSDGKWANPRPLAYLSVALGLVGVFRFLSVSDYEEENMPAFAYWFSTYALLLWVTFFVFALRKEIFHMIKALMDAVLLSTFAYCAARTASIDVKTAPSGVVICFTTLFFCLFLCTIFMAKNGSAQTMDISSIDIISAGFLALSLLTIYFSITTESFVGTIISQVIVLINSIFQLYGALAELLNSIAQKQLLPVVFDLMVKVRKKSDGINVNTQRTANIDLSGITLGEMELGNSTSTSSSDRGCFIPPGDENILGRSGFETPIAAMFAGIAISSLVTSAAFFESLPFHHDAMTTNTALLLSSLANVVAQSPIVIIFGARGQTSLAFCSFLFWLDGAIILSLDPSPGHLQHFRSAFAIIVSILVLQAGWVLASYRLFKPLTLIVVLYMIGNITALISSQLSWDGGKSLLLCMKTFTAIVFMCIFVISIVVCSSLLGCHGDIEVCRDFYDKFYSSLDKEGSDDDDENDGKCPMGYARNRSDFEECINILKEGGVCCIPTDTVYCLACRADNAAAIERIYDIKCRPSEKPLSLWFSSMDEIKEVGPDGRGWGTKLFAFMESIWPGSVSLVVSRGDWLDRMGVQGSSANLIGTHDSIALRIPNSTLTVSLLRESGPLAITSANPSGLADCTHHNKVDDVIATKIDYILADGSSPMTIASSVIDVRDLDEKNEIFFYRVGCVPETDIRMKIDRINADMRLGMSAKAVIYSDIPVTKLPSVRSLMKLTTEAVSCDKWQIYYQNMKEGESVSVVTQDSTYPVPWDSLCEKIPKMSNVFSDGVVYYSSRRSDILKLDRCEMLVPIKMRYCCNEGICAVLHLLSKRSTSGSLEPFTKADLRLVKQACAALADHFVITGDEEA